jgi:chromosome partitioning protein
MIISVMNQKGGAGKTTVATNLSCALFKAGYSTVLVDSDPQGSARDWLEANSEPEVEVVALDRPAMLSSVKKMKVDYVVIDGAPRAGLMTAETIKVSDLVILPVQPAPYDLWALSELVEMVLERQSLTDGKLKAGFVISRAIQNTQLGAEIEKALSEYKLPVLGITHNRQIYMKAAAQGKSVLAFDDLKAKEEIDFIAKSVIEIFK